MYLFLVEDKVISMAKGVVSGPIVFIHFLGLELDKMMIDADSMGVDDAKTAIFSGRRGSFFCALFRYYFFYFCCE